ALSAISFLRTALGAKLRASFKVSTGFGHLFNQPKSTSASSTGCCLVGSGLGGVSSASAKENVSPRVIFAIGDSSWWRGVGWCVDHHSLIGAEIYDNVDAIDFVAGSVGSGSCAGT